MYDVYMRSIGLVHAKINKIQCMRKTLVYITNTKTNNYDKFTSNIALHLQTVTFWTINVI